MAKSEPIASVIEYSSGSVDLHESQKIILNKDARRTCVQDHVSLESRQIYQILADYVRGRKVGCLLL